MHPLQPALASCCLSHFQAQEFLEAWKAGRTEQESSLDLNQTRLVLSLESEGVRLPQGLVVGWSEIEKIAQHDSVCFELVEQEWSPMRSFDEAAGLSFQLWPTPSSPALLLSGFVMHRVKEIAPHQGAQKMVDALGPIRGAWLDTTSGLGYASLYAAQRGARVLSIEKQPTVRELSRRNPWSRALFEHPQIELRQGRSEELIHQLETGRFQAVLHDPPAINIAGELYSTEFYRQVARVLSGKGRLFHYVGDPKSASGGRTTQGVVKRLREAGFREVRPAPEAYGVLAKK